MPYRTIHQARREMFEDERECKFVKQKFERTITITFEEYKDLKVKRLEHELDLYRSFNADLDLERREVLGTLPREVAMKDIETIQAIKVIRNLENRVSYYLDCLREEYAQWVGQFSDAVSAKEGVKTTTSQPEGQEATTHPQT